MPACWLTGLRRHVGGGRCTHPPPNPFHHRHLQSHARHRMKVEAALEGTGHTQCEVVEWLAEQLLGDVFTSTTLEVQALYDSVMDSLLDSL